MNKSKLYQQYELQISELVKSISLEMETQESIAQEERNLVAKVEKNYMQKKAELDHAKQIASTQYRNIWHSCTTNTTLRRPEAQRPAYTELNWHECINAQEIAAKKIQDWFSYKKKLAIAERLRKLKLENERKIANALLAEEEKRRRKEEADALEAEKGASLLKELKQKFKKYD